MAEHFDVLIVGGGMVGASLAHALRGCGPRGSGLRIGMIEVSAEDALVQPSYDERSIALSFGSRRIFEQLGVWDALSPAGSPIERIHVSDRGHFGFSHLDAKEEGVDALGYVTPARAIGAALLPGLAHIEELTVFHPAEVVSVEQDAVGERVSLQVDVDGVMQTMTTRLAVAADGGRSTLRESQQIPVTEYDYGHTAVISTVTPGRPHGQVAYERFTNTGPLALLPMTDNRLSLVWTFHTDDADAALAWSDEQFLSRLQERFGFRVGRFEKVGKRFAYPLKRVQANQQVKGRVVLIGNAAHTLHPIGGQGFNLGLRDVAVLAALIKAAPMGQEGQRDPGGADLLTRYEKQRKVDQREIIGVTDAMARLFSNDSKALAGARGLGMVAMDLCPPVRHKFARHAMGLGGGLPRVSG